MGESVTDPIISLSCEGHSERFKVRKSVLYCASEYFQTSFSFDKDTSEVKFDPNIIAYSALSDLVDYMWTDTLTPTMDRVEQLILAADYLQMKAALKLLVEFLFQDMAKQDPSKMKRQVLLMYLRLIRIIKDHPIKGEPINYIGVTKDKKERTWSKAPDVDTIIAMGFKSVMFEKSVLELSFIDLEEILDSHALNISEKDVVRTIKMWINYKFDERKGHFPELIRCMRYDKDMEMDFIMEELLCYCKCKCHCLTAKEYVIAIIAQRNNYTKELSDKGPRHTSVRGYSYWKLAP